MHENEFEKQVQKKMEELQFAPSDAVWKNVDKEINKKEKRRPVFWIFFFLGLILIGGGVYFVMTDRSAKVEKLNELSGLKGEKKVEGLDELKESKKVEELSELKKLKGDENLEKLKTDKIETVANNNKNSKNKKRNDGNEDKLMPLKEFEKLNNLKRKKVIQDDKIGSSIAIKTNRSKSFINRKTNADIKENDSTENGSKKNNDESVVNKNNTEDNIITKEEKNIVQDSSVDKTEPVAIENKKNIVADNKTVLADSSTNKRTAKDNTKLKKPSPWRIGFDIAPGISSVKRGLFKSALNVNAANSPTPGSPSASYSSASEIKSGFSFDVGVSINKAISKRLVFSTGLNYHYYSTNTSTGKFVDSGTNVYLSYNNSNITSPINGYYVSGNNKYINSYHFIELPLSLGLHLNKNQKNPLIWQVGMSVSYLINSNALNFDPIKNVYYKNNDLFNKTQFNFATSLMVGFRVHKNEMEIGPQFQYGLTGLLKKSTGNDEHTFFTGIKFSYILNKK